MKVINQVANKYKVIAQCATALSDELYDAKNFTRYSFMSSFQTSQIGRAAAYYYSQRKKGTSPWQSGVYLSLTCCYHLRYMAVLLNLEKTQFSSYAK